MSDAAAHDAEAENCDASHGVPSELACEHEFTPKRSKREMLPTFRVLCA
jgi:hypothetical protein